MNLKEVEYTEHESAVKASWQRCRALGLTHQSQPIVDRLNASDLSLLLDQHRHLITTTHDQVLPYFEDLLVNSNSLVMLTDSQGYVMESWGEQKFKQQHAEMFMSGASWQENKLGTNAIGTVVETSRLVQVEHEQHFLVANRFMSGSAAPIFGVDREMLGIIDISSDTYMPESHTLGMVKIMSQAIENQLITSHFKNQYFIMRFNTSPNSIDSQWSALLVFDETGLVVSANRRAELMLSNDLQQVNVTDLFDININQLINQAEGMHIPLLTTQQFRLYGTLQKASREKPKVIDLSNHSKKNRPRHISDNQILTLDEINLGDQVMAKAVSQCRRIVDKDIPILIRGETGVGKEVFVKALHQASKRNKQNMVTVNCAAIPHDLVESELFGYEKGAFTGSNNKGYIGLIRKANKGTLFLDEIGDMPVKVQARLLRVLQERQVTPLGSTESFPVDFTLVSATHCNLKEAVTEGSFRQDLYYRVSGLNIELPALRHRSDRQQLIQFLLNYHAENQKHSMLTEPVMQAFSQHPWPGNIRQMVSVIKIAQAMSDNEIVDLQHLPDDFFCDMEPQRANVKPFAPVKSDSEPDSNDHIYDNDDIVYLYQSLSCNISKTAKKLGVSRNTVYKRLRDSGYK